MDSFDVFFGFVVGIVLAFVVALGIAGVSEKAGRDACVDATGAKNCELRWVPVNVQ